jgi:hypothetical protein
MAGLLPVSVPAGHQACACGCSELCMLALVYMYVEAACIPAEVMQVRRNFGYCC